MAGTAPRLAAGYARRLSARIGEMKLVVADQPRALQPEPPVARRRFHHANGRMAVDGDDPFALAPLDQHPEALHRQEEGQSLHPSDGDAQSIVVAKVLELGSIFPLDGGYPHRLAFAVGFRLVA